MPTMLRVTVRNQEPSGVGGGSQESQVSFPRQSDSPGDIILSTDDYLISDFDPRRARGCQRPESGQISLQ